MEFSIRCAHWDCIAFCDFNTLVAIPCKPLLFGWKLEAAFISQSWHSCGFSNTNSIPANFSWSVSLASPNFHVQPGFFWVFLRVFFIGMLATKKIKTNNCFVISSSKLTNSKMIIVLKCLLFHEAYNLSFLCMTLKVNSNSSSEILTRI